MKNKFIEVTVTVKINPVNKKNCGIVNDRGLIGCEYLTVWDIGVYHCFLFQTAVEKNVNNCFKRCAACRAATKKGEA